VQQAMPHCWVEYILRDRANDPGVAAAPIRCHRELDIIGALNSLLPSVLRPALGMFACTRLATRPDRRVGAFVRGEMRKPLLIE
jgi:hypothetical protein